MAYEEKTDWLPDDPINEDDVNRWEKGIKDAHTDLAAHKNDMNNPHKTTKAQVGLGNVDNVQQAAKKDVDQHLQDQDRHVTKEERQKWNNGQLTKITDDSGKYLISIQDGLDFHQVSGDLNQSFFFYTNPNGVNTPSLPARGVYIGEASQGEALAMDEQGNTWRKTLHVSGWTDWIQIETAEGAKKKADIAFNDSKNYTNSNAFVTRGVNSISDANDLTLPPGTYRLDTNYMNANPALQKQFPQNDNKTGLLVVYPSANKWATRQDWFSLSNKTLYTRTAMNGTDFSDWSAAETAAGAEAKADRALVSAKSYTDAHEMKADIHVSSADKAKWNEAQLWKITGDNGGELITIGDTDDFFSKIVQSGRRFGTFYSTGTAANSASSVSTRGYYHFTSLDSDGTGTYGYVVAIDYYNNMFTNYLDKNKGWQGWRTVQTDAPLAWNDITLKNGATHGSRNAQYARYGPLLLLRGLVNTDREQTFGVIPKVHAPKQRTSTMVGTQSTTGISKLYFETDGTLNLTGLIVNKEANISGYFLDNITFAVSEA
ncbi:hypothetical protein KY305_13865 [Bacillus sp. YC2]|nr:hypothetical protein [Bacillus sp. YC2]MBY8913824.1 hypothetical protein [Bacillus sp. YC2]